MPGWRREGLPPGPVSPSLLQTLIFWRRPLEYLERCRERHGSAFTLRPAGFPPLVFLSEPADVRAMLGAPAEVLWPGEGGATIMPIVGERSFMLLEEDEHLAARRVVLPGFHAKVVREHAAQVGEMTRREVAGWPVDEAFALHPRLRSLTLRIVLARLFGCGQPELIETLQRRVLSMLEVTASLILPEPRLRHGPGGPPWRRFLRERTEVDELILALIEQRRRSGQGGQDVLDLLMAASSPDGSPRPAREVRDDVMSVILAGHETTASELSWAFQLLAHHPLARDRLVAELGRGEQSAYLTATVREVLRHRPVFLFTIPRAVKEEIEIGGRRYRPPVHLLGCIYLMHHDPAVYEEPWRFEPERFLAQATPTGTWLPWGGGRKRCPGLHMAVMEMQIVLATVLSQLTLSPCRGGLERPRWRSVIVTPERGSRVLLRRRSDYSPNRSAASHASRVLLS